MVKLRAITEVNPTALAAAQTADEERVKAALVRTSLGPLHGIPVLIKDNIAVLDMNNTAGSVCMLGSRAQSASSLVAKLRKAGAIILGKTNMSEWAGARSIHNDTIGWSGYGGLCQAAYVNDQCPSGSSSDSAVAVSVGLAPVAFGTETDGSIISPSSHSNLVGIKPTMGLTSRFGVIPITHRQDTVGPMCKTVSDCARVLSVIAGKDPKDNYTYAQPFDSPLDYTQFLDRRALNGARIGIPWNTLDFDVYNNTENESQVRSMTAALKRSIKLLEEAGAMVVTANYTLLNLPRKDFVQWRQGNGSITYHADMLAGINQYLEELEVLLPGIKTFADLINCTKHDPREKYPNIDMEIWDRALKHNYSSGSAMVWQAYQDSIRLAGEGAIITALMTYRLDALFLPSYAAYDMAAPLGAPVITVPLGVFGNDVARHTSLNGVT